MGTKKIKLIVLIKNIDGGTGTFLNQLSKLPGFIDNELEISVLALQKGKNTPLSNFSYISYYSNSRTRDKYNASVSELFNIIKELWWLGKEVKKIRPDVILSIDTHCNLLCCIIKKVFLKKTKLIISIHNNLSQVAVNKAPLLRSKLKFIGKYLFLTADKIVCNSEGVGKDFKDFFSIKKAVTVVPHGLNFSEINKLKNKPIQKDLDAIFRKNSFKIITIGRFEEQKDFETLIKAFKKVAAKIREVDLVLIGDGSQKQLLVNLVRDLKMEKNVHFLGWQSNIYPFLKRSDLFVLSSKYEGFGYVLIEAMSQGIPVISTNSPYGPSEVLGNGKYGILIPVGSISKMISAMLEVINNESEYNKYSLKSLERAGFYNESKMLNEYKKLLNSL